MIAASVVLLAGCPKQPAKTPTTTTPPAPAPAPAPSPQEAVDAARAAYDASGSTADADHLIAAYLALGDARFAEERWEESINAYEEARALATELDRTGPDRRRVLLDCYRKLARATDAGGSPAGAVELAVRASALSSQLIVESPDDMDLAMLRGDVMYEAGDLRRRTGRPDVARLHFLEAKSAYETVLFYDAGNAAAREGVARAEAALADLPPAPEDEGEDDGESG